MWYLGYARFSYPGGASDNCSTKDVSTDMILGISSGPVKAAQQCQPLRLVLFVDHL